jgi:hypothetical protein
MRARRYIEKRSPGAMQLAAGAYWSDRIEPRLHSEQRARTQ